MPYALFETQTPPATGGRFSPATNDRGVPKFDRNESVEFEIDLGYYYWHHEPGGLAPVAPSKMVNKSGPATLYVTNQRAVWATPPERAVPKKKLFGRASSEPGPPTCLTGFIPLECLSIVALEPDPKNEFGGILALIVNEGDPITGTMHLVRLGLDMGRSDAEDFLRELAHFVDEVSHPAIRLDEPLVTEQGALRYMFRNYVDLDGQSFYGK